MQVILIDNKDSRTVRDLYRNILDKDDKKVVCVTVTLTCFNLTQFTCWHAVCSRTVRIIAEMFFQRGKFMREGTWKGRESFGTQVGELKSSMTLKHCGRT